MVIALAITMAFASYSSEASISMDLTQGTLVIASDYNIHPSAASESSIVPFEA